MEQQQAILLHLASLDLDLAQHMVVQQEKFHQLGQQKTIEELAPEFLTVLVFL